MGSWHNTSRHRFNIGDKVLVWRKYIGTIVGTAFGGGYQVEMDGFVWVLSKSDFELLERRTYSDDEIKRFNEMVQYRHNDLIVLIPAIAISYFMLFSWFMTEGAQFGGVSMGLFMFCTVFLLLPTTIHDKEKQNV